MRTLGRSENFEVGAKPEQELGSVVGAFDRQFGRPPALPNPLPNHDRRSKPPARGCHAPALRSIANRLRGSFGSARRSRFSASGRSSSFKRLQRSGEESSVAKPKLSNSVICLSDSFSRKRLFGQRSSGACPVGTDAGIVCDGGRQRACASAFSTAAMISAMLLVCTAILVRSCSATNLRLARAPTPRCSAGPARCFNMRLRIGNRSRESLRSRAQFALVFTRRSSIKSRRQERSAFAA